MYNSTIRFDANARGLWLLFLLLIVVLTPGCGGCVDLGSKDGSSQLGEEDQSEFEPSKLTILPSGKYNTAKPGHWVEIRQVTKSNGYDFAGESVMTPTGDSMKACRLDRSPFVAESTRRIVLPKGQKRTVDQPLYFPAGSGGDSRPSTMGVHVKLRGRTMERAVDWGVINASRMPGHQFHFVVLADREDAYGFLRQTQTVAPVTGEYRLLGTERLNYLVSVPDVKTDNLPLPHSNAYWTSTAFVLWDQVDPESLAKSQAQAMIDWLHWGGQLVISGPNSLERLGGSFLRDYLPAMAGPTRVASDESLRAFDKHWSIVPKETKLGRTYKLVNFSEPWQIVELQLTDGSRFVPETGGLVAERQTGRGRIVVTAFPLADSRLRRWPSFDGFLNSCLLNRPARRFSRIDEATIQFHWRDCPAPTIDPLLSSHLRYFSRDAQSGDRKDLVLHSNKRSKTDVLPPAKAGTLKASGKVPVGMDGYASNDRTGVASWDDFCQVAQASRESLAKSAGLDLPNAEFVAIVLGAYLLTLVPLNWCVFRFLGKAEWAWFVAPVIAIVATFAVIRFAQLDVGFVRSRTEIAIVETQGKYPRAHVTRFAGLYTSLSTHYDFQFDGGTAIGLPFSTAPSRDELRVAKTEYMEFRQGKNPSLGGVPVISNSTGMVRAEQMIEWKSQVLLEQSGSKAVLHNGTAWNLHSTAIIRRTGDEYEIRVVGELDAGQSTDVPAEPATDRQLRSLMQATLATRSKKANGDVSLQRLYRIALEPTQLSEGDVRLVAWTDELLQGVSISPSSTQVVGRLLLVCNLKYGLSSPRTRDDNLVEEFRVLDSALIDYGDGESDTPGPD